MLIFCGRRYHLLQFTIWSSIFQVEIPGLHCVFFVGGDDERRLDGREWDVVIWKRLDNTLDINSLAILDLISSLDFVYHFQGRRGSQGDKGYHALLVSNILCIVNGGRFYESLPVWCLSIKATSSSTVLFHLVSKSSPIK